MDSETGSKFNLSPAKRALLDALLKERNLDFPTQKRIPLRGSGGPAPLSFAQQRMWFLHQMEGSSEVYNVPLIFRLQGRLDLPAMERSLNRIIQRHEILRTNFSEVEDEVRQVVAETFDLRINVHDLRSAAPEKRQALASEILVRRGREWFDLRNGPLLRVDLVRLAEEEAYLLINFHHIIIDEWSVEIFLKELRSLYIEETRGIPADLPPLPIQYADFVVWQLDWLKGEPVEKQLVYWKQELANVPQVVDLPTDFARPAVMSYRGGSASRRIAGETLENLRQIGRAERATLFTTLLAAFYVLLYRFSGQTDILVGTPIANRRQLEIENLIGFFLNTLALRGRLEGDPTFRELLKRVSETVLSAFDNQDLPFEKLVEELNPGRDLSRHPLFQIAIVVQPSGEREMGFPGLETRRVREDYGGSKFDLTLFLTEGKDFLDARFEYSLDLFEHETIQRMLACFETLLAAIVQNPDQRIEGLEMLSADERERVVEGWSTSRSDYPRTAALAELFEEQVRRTPEAIALAGAAGLQEKSGQLAGELTYRELNRGANQLAHHLKQLGLSRGGLVGISLERSPEMVVAMLAVLKAGGAYVPLDPSYPAERLAFMIEDTRLKILISKGAWAEMVPHREAQVVRMDADWPAIAGQAEDDPPLVSDPLDLAYVMYTSGSTGKPKGIGIPQRAVVRLVCGSDYVQVRAGDCIAQASNMSFDAATFEIWGALLNGGSLRIVPQEIVLDPKAFAAWLRAQDVQSLFLTTALFNQIAMVEPGAFGPLRDVMFGGEAVTPLWVRAVLEAGPPKRLLHMYGPTENTTFTTWCPVREVSSEARSIPIGKPIANTRIYVLDRWLNAVPAGVPGELFIGGDGLAWGYLDRPELTAEKFIPDPFGEAGGRLYRTGDRVRWLSDGNIEFLERIDTQVKLRGFRVELGEIESLLSSHPGVEQAVVLLKSLGEGPGMDQQLAAYVVLRPVPEGEAPVTAQDLRHFLKSRLPDYMLPAYTIFLDELPISPNGKVNRAALPDPTPERWVAAEGYAAPRDALEGQLSQLWEKVLNVRLVGIHDNFFELGGHSLLAVRLFAQIEKEMGERLPLATLFQSPTIAELAAVLRKERRAAAWSALVAIQPGGSGPVANRPPFYCVHNFGGEALDLVPLSQALGSEQPFFGLQALGLDGVQAPHTTIEEMAAYYVAAIRQHQPQGSYYLGGYCFGGVVAYEMACQLEKAGDSVAMVVVVDASAPGFSRVKGSLTPRRLWDFVLNLPFWVRDFFQMNAAERGVVVRRRLKRIGKAVERTVGIRAEMTPLEIIGDHVHVMEAPLHRRSLMELHMKAILKYHPPTYGGRVTAFRVRRMPLFSRHAYDMGWSRVAKGGVDLRLVVGAHHNVMRPPYVQELARQIRECMDLTLKG